MNKNPPLGNHPAQGRISLSEDFPVPKTVSANAHKNTCVFHISDCPLQRSERHSQFCRQFTLRNIRFFQDDFQYLIRQTAIQSASVADWRIWHLFGRTLRRGKLNRQIIAQDRVFRIRGSQLTAGLDDFLYTAAPRFNIAGAIEGIGDGWIKGNRAMVSVSVFQLSSPVAECNCC